MTDPKILKKYLNLLTDLTSVIKQKKIPILKLTNERKIDDFKLSWNFDFRKSIIQELEKQEVKITSDNRNFACKKCLQKISGIRNFLHKGKYKLLILYYSGNYFARKDYQGKTHPSRIFQNIEVNSVFEDEIKNHFGISATDLFYQEYPACNFSPTESNAEELWKDRAEACEEYIKATLQEYSISNIIYYGASALAKFGKKVASEKTGIISEMNLGDSIVKYSILRSPEAIVQLRKRIQTGKNVQESEAELKEIVSQYTNVLGFFKKEIH